MFLDAESTEQLNRQRIASWWALLGCEPEYPAKTATVVEMLQAVEYAIDADDLVAIAGTWFPSPERESSRLAWTATDIVAAAMALECRRLWKPFSKIHGGKLTLAEKMRQTAEHRGDELFSDLAGLDVRRLLAALHEVRNDPEAVSWVATGLELKLQQAGIWEPKA